MNALNFYAENPPFMNISLHKDVTKRQVVTRAGAYFAFFLSNTHPSWKSKSIVTKFDKKILAIYGLINKHRARHLID